MFVQVSTLACLCEVSTYTVESYLFLLLVSLNSCQLYASGERGLSPGVGCYRSNGIEYTYICTIVHISINRCLSYCGVLVDFVSEECYKSRIWKIRWKSTWASSTRLSSYSMFFEYKIMKLITYVQFINKSKYTFIMRLKQSTRSIIISQSKRTVIYLLTHNYY